MSCFKFRGGNDDRNGIYSSPKEIISNAISFVSLFHGPVAKNTRAIHTRWPAQNVVKLAHLMAMIYISGATNDIFRKISVRKTICDLEFSEHFVVKFLACLPLLGFSNM